MPDSDWQVGWDLAAVELLARVKAEAARIGDDYLGTRHLLLALIANSPIEGVPELTLDAARTAVVTDRVPREEGAITITPWTQTPRLKLAIQRAMQQASAESRPVSCIDLWDGMLDDPQSESWPLLHALGVNAVHLRNPRQTSSST